MEKTNLNLIPEKEKPIVNASQFDDGRVVRFILKDGEGAYIPVGGESVACNIRKPDNNVVTISCTLTSIVEDEETIGSYVDVVLTEQANACVGEAFGELVLTKGDDFVIGTCNFILAVERSPIAGGVTSTTVIDDLYTQVEEITLQVIGDDYYTKTQVDDLLDLKADAATTYTKTEVDAALALKADKSTTYTKTQVDAALALKADASSVYTKGQVDAALDLKADASSVYTKTQVDNALALKANTADLATVATTGDYDDLTNKPTIPAAQVQSDYAQSDNTQVDYIKNKPDLSVFVTSDALNAIIYDLLPVGTASGAIANFDTDLTLPLVDCKANIVASQASGTPTPSTPLPISGYTEANITRCGVNLWDEEWESGSYNVNTGAKQDDSSKIRMKNLMPILPNTTYYKKAPIGGFYWHIYYDANKNYIGYVGVSYNQTFTTPSNAYYMASNCESVYGTTYNHDISINYPSTDTNYHAYNGTTVTIAFGQTVYGGTLDVTRGKLSVDHVMTDLGDYTYTYYTSGTYPYMRTLYPLTNAISKGNYDISSILCDIAEPKKPADIYNTNANGIALDNALQIRIRVDGMGTDPDAFKTFVTGHKFVYPLATPFDIDLTPVQINALLGVNNVYNDTNGDTEVKYKDSIQHYIDTRA